MRFAFIPLLLTFLNFLLGHCVARQAQVGMAGVRRCSFAAPSGSLEVHSVMTHFLATTASSTFVA